MVESACSLVLDALRLSSSAGYLSLRPAWLVERRSAKHEENTAYTCEAIDIYISKGGHLRDVRLISDPSGGGHTSNTPPRGEAPNPSTETFSPVEPRLRRSIGDSILMLYETFRLAAYRGVWKASGKGNQWDQGKQRLLMFFNYKRSISFTLPSQRRSPV